MKRRKTTRQVDVDGVKIGGGAPISVQSMLSIPASDIERSVSQAVSLEHAGCDILRAAIPSLDDVALIPAIKEKCNLPLVADIHFNHKIALESVAAGIDKIRINPGNIGNDEHVKAVANACKAKSIPIRIGVNTGSLEKTILAKHGKPTAGALVESALYHASLLEKYDFEDIVISLKASSVDMMIEAYELISEKTDYPLHLGVTEAGTYNMGLIKSSIGIGSLLQRGIGDTIRVSLTDEPTSEVKAGIDILKALDLRGGVKFISCPTCGRTKIDLMGLAKRVEEKLANEKRDISVAIMGCEVNGPGEAREADIGIAGGAGVGLIFKKGEIVKKVDESELLDELMLEIEKL